MIRFRFWLASKWVMPAVWLGDCFVNRWRERNHGVLCAEEKLLAILDLLPGYRVEDMPLRLRILCRYVIDPIYRSSDWILRDWCEYRSWREYAGRVT